jgi:hypothetical protein
MICTKKNHAGGEHCVTCVEHEAFRRIGERRRERGIRLGKFTIRCDTAAIVSLNNFWEGWIQVLGKEKATDYLVVAMRKADEALRRALDARNKRK